MPVTKVCSNNFIECYFKSHNKYRGYLNESIYVALTQASGPHCGSIIFGNARVPVEAYPGTPVPASNTDYWLLCHYSYGVTYHVSMKSCQET